MSEIPSGAELEWIASQPDNESHSPEKEKPGEQLSYILKLKEGYTGATIKVILNDPELAPRFRDLFQDADFLDQPDSLDYRTKKITKLITALMRDPQTRELFIEALTADMRDRSSNLKNVVFESEGKLTKEDILKAKVYDEVVIGAGVVSSIYNIARSDRNSGIKSLTLEASNVVSRNFDTFRNFLRINSDNTAEYGDLPTLTGSNLNTFGRASVTQIPYFESERYPTGGAFADLATGDQFFADNEIMMGTETISFESGKKTAGSESWPAPDRIKIRDAQSRRESYIYTHRVITAAGMGKAGIPKLDDESNELMQPQVDQADRTLELGREAMEAGLIEDADFPPPSKMMTYEQLAQYVNLVPTALRYFAGKRIGIVGGADSSMTVVEYFMRESDKKALGKHAAQFGEPSALVWMGQDAKTSRDLLAKVYERYAQVAMGLPSAEGKHEHLPFIEPVPGYLNQVRKSDKPKGEFDVLVKVPPGKDGKPASSMNAEVDYLIFTTGFEDGIGKVFGKTADAKTGRAENPFKNDQEAENINHQYSDVGQVTIARKLKGEEVYGLGLMMGPQLSFQALREGRTDKTAKQGDMKVTVQAMGPRAEKAAEMLATPSADHKLPRFEYHQPEIELSADPSNENHYNIDLKKLLPIKKVDRRRLKIKLSKVFSQTRFALQETEKILTLNVKPERSDEDEAAVLRFTPNLDDQSGEDIFQALGGEKRTFEQINALLGKPGKHAKTLTLEVPYARGKPIIPRLNFFEKR